MRALAGGTLMTLRFTGFAHTNRYAASDVPGGEWAPGEVRSVPDDVGRRLLADFPGAFVVVAVAPAMVAPPADRMMRSSRKRS